MSLGIISYIHFIYIILLTIYKNNSLTYSTFSPPSPQVYVGAVNKLYQISSDLNIIAAVTTGPHNDSNECSILECPIDIVRRPTDNWNKVLLIDHSAGNLIVCGSLFQGICHIRSLQNVSIIEHEMQEAVVANVPNASTVAFIAPGPPVPSENNVFYVGVTFTGNSPYRSEIPAVASRSLARDKLFQIASSAVTTGTRIFVNSYARESFLINYVYGFSSERFSYFLTTQHKSSAHNTPKELITKLVRICQDDSNYYSYTEIPVDCISESTKFNVVNAAHVGKPGPDLAENLGITTEDDVLFAVFSDSNDSKNANKSALCIYSLKAIRRKFMQNIKSCFNGIGQRGLDYISVNMPCVPTKLQTISEDFCGLDVNSPLGGEQAIASIPVLLSELKMTSIAVTTTSNFTVVFIGTLTGQLKKVVVESSGSAQQYALMNVDVGSKIQPDMYLDTVKYDLYLMSTHKLFKIKVYDCSVYTTCVACLSAKDPFCGWCSLENKCSPKSECQDNFKDPLSWLSYKSGKCTTITSVSPSQLQRTTARTLELMIENLPNLKEPLVCAFTFANMEKPIITNATKKRNGVNCTTPRTDLLPQIGYGKSEYTDTSYYEVF